MKPLATQISLRRGAGAGGFTLLEIVLAAAILIIISITVFQFTSISMTTTDIALRESMDAQTGGGFRRLLETQLASLPSNQNGALIGMVIDGKGGGRRDALQLVCPAGNAVLTPDAKGLYEITLGLREIPRGSGHYCLGMERTPWTDDDNDDDDADTDKKVSSTKVTDVTKVRETLPSDWVKLMDNVKGVEFAYFDSRLNGWVDKWTDTSFLPSLVRARLTMGAGREPYEIIERVPGGAANVRVIPTVTQPETANPNGTNLNSAPSGDHGSLALAGAILPRCTSRLSCSLRKPAARSRW